MGRIKTDMIKRVTRKLMAKNADKFSTDFEKNKKSVSEAAALPSKKIRNTVAGYITRMVKMKNKPRSRRIIPMDEEKWSR
jgi:small subunit ribosomal protein S17e